MGTTLHAIVEKLDLNTKRWHAVSEWHLEKDYELMGQLDSCRHDPNWPSDVSFRSQYMIDRDTSHCRRSFSPHDLPSIDGSSDRYRSMVFSLPILDLALVRVLFYRM
jgi:hypothetical protein